MVLVVLAALIFSIETLTAGSKSLDAVVSYDRHIDQPNWLNRCDDNKTNNMQQTPKEALNGPSTLRFVSRPNEDPVWLRLAQSVEIKPAIAYKWNTPSLYINGIDWRNWDKPEAKLTGADVNVKIEF